MRIYPSPVVNMNGKAPLLQRTPQAAQGTFRWLRSSKDAHYSARFFRIRGLLVDAIPSEQIFAVVADAEWRRGGIARGTAGP
jgi:hypothetical protein